MKNIRGYTEHIFESSKESTKSSEELGRELAEWIGTIAQPKMWVFDGYIDRGADIDVPDGTGCTPLCTSVLMGWRELSKRLIDMGADISKAFRDVDGLRDFFHGDISWIPEDQPGFDRIRKVSRARGAFGRF